MGATASFPRFAGRDEEEVVILEGGIFKFDSSDSRDISAMEMYTSSPKIDAIQHVLSSQAGREAFMTYLETEFAEENLKFFIVSSIDFYRFYVSQ